ncbi:MAG: thioredoxin [Ignavibacterium sp.]|nr:thioredoxin [Ignavibacterium sp.]MCX7610669.1 thioredoxin [Ignavibacterium sp.]MDW8375527.1 thioredoxin [Ignavibacteriales bacterium]
MKPYTFTDQNFEEEVIKSELPVLVDFWAVWCGPCKMIAPIVEQLAEELAGKVKVGKLDVDSNQETSIKYGIRGIPTLLIFKNGQVVDTIVGAVPKATILNKLQSHISN